MKRYTLTLLSLVLITLLAGCGGDASPSTQEQGRSAQPAESSADGTGLNADYESALSVGNQLALGTFWLEETADAVTPEQAEVLLPLWQAIQGGALQSEAETNAVLQQIEGTMTAEQVAAIAAMQLTFEDLNTWAQERGANLEFSPEAMATRQAAGTGPGVFGDVSRAEREAMRATAQAGGLGGVGPGGLGAMSEEERAAMRATAEANGMTFPGGQDRAFAGRGAGGGQVAFLAQPLLDLLTQRAAK